MKRTRFAAEELQEKMREFKLSVVGQPCGGCGKHGIYTHPAHHVCYRQHVPVEHEWDARNAMAVCRGCHERHHNASKRIPLSALSEENLEFANEVLGEAAPYYLERRYG